MPVRALSRLKRNRRRLHERIALLALVAACLALVCADGNAQLSGSVSAVSDYRYRGVSLSGNDPALQAAVNYDDPRGFYGGVFLSSVRFAFTSGREAQAVPFAGYAWRLPSGDSGELGIDYSAFTRTHIYDHAEAYWGFTSGNVNGRLHYAPRYFGIGGKSVYAELNAAQPLSERVRAIAHIGVLHAQSRNFYEGSGGRAVFDGRIGVGIDVDPFNVELSWVGLSARSAYAFTGEGRRNGVVVTLMRLF